MIKIIVDKDDSVFFIKNIKSFLQWFTIYKMVGGR